jgi:homoserine kinase type II
MDAIARYEALIAQRPGRTGFDEFAAGQLPRRRLLVESSEHLRPDAASEWEPSGWAHGDFHDLNVLWDEHGQVAAVLDFDRLAPRPYAFELVRSATLTFSHGDDRGLDLDRVTAFVSRYLGVFPLGAGQILQAVRGLWWERACDFWQLKLHYVKDDHSCDHLFMSASALLWWWTGHRADVEDVFTSR